MSFAPFISPPSTLCGADGCDGGVSGLIAFLQRIALWLGIFQAPDVHYIKPYNAPKLYRHERHMAARQHMPVSRSTSALRAFMPKDLSRTQYLERCTKLSVMGRFQIYDWLYYRWEFWKVSTLKALNLLGVFTIKTPRECHASPWPD